MTADLERAIHLWRYRVLYSDSQGHYRWSRRAALPRGARAGRIAAPYSGLLREHYAAPKDIPTTSAPQQLSLLRSGETYLSTLSENPL